MAYRITTKPLVTAKDIRTGTAMSDLETTHGWNSATRTCTCGVLSCPTLRTEMNRRAASINRRAVELSDRGDDPPQLAIPHPR